MIGFHVPSFAIESGHLVKSEGGIAGHQILNTHTAIFVCEDLLDQQEREIDTFQIDFQRGIGLEGHSVQSFPLTVAFGLLTQGDFTIGLERHDKGFAQVMLDEPHILGGAVPDITQDILEGDLVVLGVGQQLTVSLIFADRGAAFLLAVLFIDILFGFRHDTKPNRQRVATGMIQARHEIDAFHAPVLAVIVVPADDLVLVGVRLFRKTVIDDEHAICLLNLSHIRFHKLPQISRTQLLFRQQPLNPVMAHAAAQQFSQARSGRLSEGADQIIAIDVQQFFVFHPLSLAHSA